LRGVGKVGRSWRRCWNEEVHDDGADQQADIQRPCDAEAAFVPRDLRCCCRRRCLGRGRDGARDGFDSAERIGAARTRSGSSQQRGRSREASGYTGPERRVAERRADSGLERRRGPGRRRSDDRKAAEEGEMTNEQFEFCMAIETYKKVNKKMYPTWTEVLEVIRHLGYRKVSPRDIKLENCPEPELFKLKNDRSADAA
jgi:hypothetical protein